MGAQDNYNTGIMSDLQGFFQEGQREAIYNACSNPRDKLLIRLLWKTGRRIGEILALNVNEIDFEHKNILWHIEKKKREFLKWKPIDKETLDMLNDYIKSAGLYDEDPVFLNFNTGRGLTRIRAYQIVRDSAKKAGMYFIGKKKPHPHHFRHSFAIEKARKLKSPADMRKLQQYMEHSNMGMTEQYLQFGDEDQRSLVEEDEEPQKSKNI